MLKKLSVKRSSNVGLYVVATNDFVLVPEGLKEKEREEIERALEVNAIETRVGGSSLLGVFLVANSRGVVVPWLMEEKEIERLEREGVKVHVYRDRVTALGNLIALNDRGMIVSEEVSNPDEIASFLRVSFLQSNIGGIEVVGSSIVSNNKGFVAHPYLEGHLHEIERVLGVKGGVTTVNFGDPFVKTGVVANDKGVIVGEECTPIEVMNVSNWLE